jgi:hypothetical protein
MRLGSRVLMLVFAAPALCSALQAHSQVLSVYGLFTPQHATNVQTGSVYSGGSYNEQYTSFWAPGFGGGVTLNFLNLHIIKLGIDLRGSTKPGTTGADTAQGALRLGFQPPWLKIKPYVQAGVGYLATRTTNVTTTPGSSTPVGGTFSNQYATYGVQGGVDTRLAPFVDLRLIELGVSHAFNTGISTSAGNATLFSIGTGVVLHF